MQLELHKFTVPMTCPKDQHFKTKYVPESMFNFAFVEIPLAVNKNGFTMITIKKVYFLKQFCN